MSSPDRIARRASTALALVSALFLSACFRPMYASVSSTGVPLTATMASVTIPAVDGRVPQQVRNHLDFALTGGAAHAPTRYVLDLQVTSVHTSSIVNVRTDEPEIDTVIVTANFTLTAPGSQTAVLSGRNISTKSYDRTLQRFAASRALRDAEDSAARVVADQIHTRVAAYLAANP